MSLNDKKRIALSTTISGVSYPLSLPGVLVDIDKPALPLFEKKNETVLRLNNPHFVNVFFLIPIASAPTCPSMTVLETWITDGKYSYWSGIPSNSGGDSKLAWGGSWPSDGSVDWRVGGSFDIDFPVGGLYWIESRSPDLLVQNTFIDTRYPTPVVPSGFNAQDIGSQKVKFDWQDVSNNENSFHILIEQMIGDKWIKLPYQRAASNTNTFTWQAQPGYYRFAIRAALSTSDEVVSFQRRIPSGAIEGEAKTEIFTIPGTIKYSNQTSWKYLLVNGTFANPVTPTNFGGTTKADKSLFFVWQDNSNNESVFHILEDKFINGVWVRQQQIRVPANRISWTIPPKASGKYRYSIRSAYSFPETSIVKTSPTSNWIEFVVP
jgi:hypothetical protein